MIGNLTANDWTVGHKSIFGYYARSGCPARAAYSPSTTTATMQQRYLEFAATRHLLKFDMKRIPFGMFSTANVYLRFRNPSWLQQVSIGGAGLGYNFAHNDTSDILYKFSDSPLLPKDLETGTYGYCRLCDGYFANKGQMSSGGTSCGYGHYDPWNLAGSTTVYSRTMTPYFYDQTEWDNDHQVSDADVLEQLKLAASSSRYVYMLIGPRIGNGISSSSTYGASVGSVMAAYTTRVELVLRLTGNAYNA